MPTTVDLRTYRGNAEVACCSFLYSLWDASDLGTQIVKGNAFTLSSGATLRIGSPLGITSSGATGNVQTTSRTFSTGGNYVYNGTGAQAAGSGLPATVNNLTLSGGGIKTMPVSLTTVSSDLTVSGSTLAFGAGSAEILTVGGNVTFNSSATYKVEYGISPDCDKLNLSKSGTLFLNDATLELVGVGTNFLNGAGCTIALNATNIVGTFKDLTNGAPVPGNDGYYIHYVTNRTELGYGSYIVINKSSDPTSSGIDLRAYQSADGVYVEFVAYDVENDGTAVLSVLGADGRVIWSGTTNVLAGERYVCRFLVPGLEVGGTYNFAVRDEIGKGWSAPGVTVTPFAAKMVSLSLTGVTLSFDSLPEREYEIQWVARLGDVWQKAATVLADSDHTSVFVAYPDPKAPSGFFRVRVK
jgi:hypothetical protein